MHPSLVPFLNEAPVFPFGTRGTVVLPKDKRESLKVAPTAPNALPCMWVARERRTSTGIWVFVLAVREAGADEVHLHRTIVHYASCKWTNPPELAFTPKTVGLREIFVGHGEFKDVDMREVSPPSEDEEDLIAAVLCDSCGVWRKVSQLEHARLALLSDIECKGMAKEGGGRWACSHAADASLQSFADAECLCLGALIQTGVDVGRRWWRIGTQNIVQEPLAP